MSAISLSGALSTPSRPNLGSSWLNDTYDIANALGIREDMVTNMDALTDLIQYLSTDSSLMPGIISILYSQSWAVEETDIVTILRSKASGDLANCIYGFAITISDLVTELFNARPSAWMWFPVKEQHISALACVLMLYLYFGRYLPQELDPTKKERMTRAYYNALEYLSNFRCCSCGGDYGDDEISKPGGDRICYICTPEEGQIVEPPQDRYLPLPYAICTHRIGDPECIHFLNY
ncbi:hypothetical protein GGR51DRAFT_559104 [Nemania sp. FL0031]|nr:hypothetical protein GGR51DRAFT_559104 [Nemania sp. FL0031]